MTANVPARPTNRFLSSLLSHSLPYTLRSQAHGCGKNSGQSILQMGHPCGMRRLRALWGVNVFEDTVSPRDTLWVPMGILAQLYTLSGVNRVMLSFPHS